ARNGEIIASSEGYKSMKSCLNGIESVKKNAPDSPIEELEQK
ncbi:MAG: YegP family protein, partial [Clostridia bacterium]|nr:YegP family protein [Clostridia bacterium]